MFAFVDASMFRTRLGISSISGMTPKLYPHQEPAIAIDLEKSYSGELEALSGVRCMLPHWVGDTEPSSL